jgi:hypothetical protein
MDGGGTPLTAISPVAEREVSAVPTLARRDVI